ncbi:MAG TPA: TetR/AcrR family transcriptional regulator [Streptosporangiaceae bacterium]|nr:TetR/AcrR family transcriptional regulator [Streptosporangiaceae bacterium]
MGTTESVVRAGKDRAMRADARRNYQRLLSAAAAAFAEQGADTASLEEIARRAGVGIGTLYRHFPTRQALLEAVYTDQVEALRVRAAELLRREPPGEALADWLRALVAFGSTKRSLTTALLQTLDKESELLSACGAVLRESTSELLERAQRAGEARTDVKGTDVLRLAHGVSMASEWAPGDPGQADRMLTLVVDGLLRRSGRTA